MIDPGRFNLLDWRYMRAFDILILIDAPEFQYSTSTNQHTRLL